MTEQALKRIRQQVGSTPDHLINVLQILSIRFQHFTPPLTTQLQRYHYIQMLTMNDCAIKSLHGFPHLPGLIRLDLVFNQIPGEDLVHLAGSRHLQTLMLGGNKVEKTEDLEALKGMRQLFQLDLINNPIQHQPGYRAKVFGMLNSLTVLDTLDKSGQDAFNTTSMSQTAARVPPTLFDTSRPPSSTFVRNHEASSDSSDSCSSQSEPVVKKSKMSKISSKYLNPTSRSATKAGLLFPVAKIKKRLHVDMENFKIKSSSAVYIAAVLEYLTAQLTDLAGTICRGQKKRFITPRMIKKAIESDEQLKHMLSNITIPLEQ